VFCLHVLVVMQAVFIIFLHNNDGTLNCTDVIKIWIELRKHRWWPSLWKEILSQQRIRH